MDINTDLAEYIQTNNTHTYRIRNVSFLVKFAYVTKWK